MEDGWDGKCTWVTHSGKIRNVYIVFVEVLMARDDLRD